MLRCSHCETENPDDARFCQECGRELSTGGSAARGRPVAASGRISCPSCGQAVDPYAQFCPACGKNLQGAEYGSFWRRFGGSLIDVIIIFIMGVVGGMIVFIVPPYASSIIGLLIGPAYVVGLNANGGTLGKRVVGLRLEDAETGEDIGYPRAFVRYIVAIASALALLLGYLWNIWDDRKQTWHDKAAGSVVVRM